MSYPTSEAAWIAAVLVSASVPLSGPLTTPPSSIGVPRWVPFVLFAGLGIASLVFAVLNPELIAAAFGQA